MTDQWLASSLSPMASELQGSSILVIAAQVRSMVAAGRQICNLTIGDFKPSEYPIPERLRESIATALQDGYTNYPPSNGIAELRHAVAGLYERRLGIAFDPGHVTICSGARPILYAAYRSVVSPGDKVIYGAPSWNNNHYAKMLGAHAVPIKVGPEDNFFPSCAHIEPHLRDTRMIALNSPLNPTGTCIRREQLVELCQAIVAENDRRRGVGERPLFLLYDQIYWLLTLGDVDHVDPVSVNPAMVDYTIYVDGISKAFAATGLRVGWGIAPAAVSGAINRLLGHVGAWAPHPAQRATAALLADDTAIDDYLAWIRKEATTRLEMLHTRLTTMGRRLPIKALSPEGAIYLSVEFALRGYRHNGQVLSTSGDVRTFLLDAAGIAVVPFDAFGAGHAQDWYRLSVGAVSVADLDAAMTRLETALVSLEAPADSASPSSAAV